MTKWKKGFTLIEILVAISIVGILSAFLLSNFVGVRERGRDTLRKSDLRQIQSALEFYRSDQGRYPNNVPNSPGSCPGSLLSDSANCGSIVYMQKVPADPSTGVRYYYNAVSANRRYCLRACLENKNDGDRDELKLGGNNPNLPGCTVPSECPTVPTKKPSYSLQNP